MDTLKIARAIALRTDLAPLGANRLEPPVKNRLGLVRWNNERTQVALWPDPCKQAGANTPW